MVARLALLLDMLPRALWLSGLRPVVSFYIGGLASGQKFDRHGLASHPTTTTSKVPVDVG